MKPYEISIPEHRLSSIRDRIRSYDWSQLPDIGGWSGGVAVPDLRRLTDFWLESYDWRTTERHLNDLPNFITEVEGEAIHFLHFKGDGSKPPILLLHGWPGSYLEFSEVWDPLTASGHDVIVPSLPGFAFSQPIRAVLGPRRIAEIMHGLMREIIAEQRYLVQGGDWGAHIASWMGALYPEALLGFHINMAYVHAIDAIPTTSEEKAYFDHRSSILDWETGYNHEQETRPQTLGAGLADSPVGAAGWMLEKFGKWADLPKLSDGSPDLWSKFSEAELITNMMLYLGPSSMVTSLWVYHGKRLEGSSAFSAGTRVTVPMGIAAFPDPVFIPTPRSFAEKTYNVIHYSELPRGGHFAAMEEPELFVEDLCAFVSSLIGGVHHG